MSCTEIIHPKAAEFKPRRLLPWSTETITTTRMVYRAIKARVLPKLEYIPRDYQKSIINRFSKVFNETDDFRKAYKYLETIVEPVDDVLNVCAFDDLDLLQDEEKRQKTADMLALSCLDKLKIMVKQEAFQELEYDERAITMYRYLWSLVKTYGSKAPYNPFPPRRCPLTAEKAESGILRLVDGEYWQKQFDTIAKRTNEHLAIAMGFVGKNISAYVSRNGLADFKMQKENNITYLKMMDAISNETGQAHNLYELTKLGSNDPEKRRIELMVRCRGLEELALKEGKQAIFLTCTAPSKYHKNSVKTKVKQGWNRSTPKQTSDYLCKVWSKVRAELARQGVEYNGVRVSEPHADATPHWHILLFVKPEQRRLLTTITRQYFTLEDRKELITSYKKHLDLVRIGKNKAYRAAWYSPRFTCEIIDPEKGSATGYIAKYISKNINGSKMEGQVDDEAEIQVNESAERVTAWASLWGIRQFQFFGAVSVSVWRECRRAKEPFSCKSMELSRQAADKGNWQEFTEAMREFKLVLSYEESEQRNDYNESIVRVSGVSVDEKPEMNITTRLESFVLQRRGAASWSPVINCTEVQNNNWTISDREKNKLNRFGFDDSSINLLLGGRTVFMNNQKFEIKNGVFVAH